MRFVVLALALALIVPAAAAAQDPPPSLTADTVFSLPGVNTLDFRADLAVDDAHGAAVDPELGRFYAVGAHGDARRRHRHRDRRAPA